MMKNYYDQSMRALQLAGMSARTQQCYTRSVRMLVDFYNKTPRSNHRSATSRLFPASQKQSQLPPLEGVA
jgi:hypothetical protein